VKRLLAGSFFAASVLVVGRGFAEPPVAPVRTDALGRSGEASVSLGVVRAQSDVRSDTAGYLRLEFPLDRTVAPRRALIATADDMSYPVEDDVRDSVTDGEDERVGEVVPALDPALLGRLARDTLAAAANAHGAGAFARDVDSAATRARSSAVLPEIRLRVAKSRDAALRLTPTVDDPYHSSLADGDGMLLEAQATFRLSRFIFADEEVPLERLRIERERLNERLEARVLARVVAWHRALSRELSAPDAETRGRAALARVDAQIELDALTDGWFEGRVRQLARGAPRVERPAPAPQTPAAPKPASKSKETSPASSQASRSAVAAMTDLEGCVGSATSAGSCSPTLETDSRTFKGASMR
jgi:hypothetical protein